MILNRKQETMIKSNFHSHSSFDDGSGALQDYAEAAIAANFRVFGFSNHAPVLFSTEWNMPAGRFDAYTAEASALKEKFKGRIELYTGLETDFYRGCVDWRNKPGIDYTIGAIHFVQNPADGRYLAFDGSRKEFEENLNCTYEGDIRLLVKDYYALVRDMLTRMPPNILAHLDVIRKNNGTGRFFDEEDAWYQEEVMKTLDVISLTHTIVEINTGGISRGYLQTPYPSRWILEECLALDIPVIVNSDTHHPDTIAFYFEEARQMLRDIGFKSQRILLGGTWQDVGL